MNDGGSHNDGNNSLQDECDDPQKTTQSTSSGNSVTEINQTRQIRREDDGEVSNESGGDVEKDCPFDGFNLMDSNANLIA